MPGIFDDEWAVCGQILSNPFGTRPISPLDGAGKRLKWQALRRVCPHHQKRNGPRRRI